MFFHLSVLIYSLIFYAGLELAAYYQNLAFYEAVILFLFSVWIARRVGKRWAFSVIPALIALSSSALLYFIDFNIERQIFIFLAVAMYYLSLLGAYRLRDYLDDQTARGLIMAAAMAAIFFFYTGSYGIHLNFFLPVWVLIASFLIPTILVSYEYFIIISKKRKKVLIYSLLLGMAMAEIALVVTFWPFGYLTTGIIALIFYYVLWDLTQSYFLNLLSKKRVVANMVFFSFLVAIILLSSHWMPEV